MTDVQEVEDEDLGTEFDIPVPKAKTNLKGWTGKLPEHVYREIVAQGWKVVLNRGMTKITKEAYPDPEELRAKALEVAEANLAAMYAGKIRITGSKTESGKVPREVMTEARRIARSLVKETLKAAGRKVSYVASAEITKAANALIATEAWILEQAYKEVEDRSAKRVKIDIESIPEDAKRVKAAEAKRADKVLSAQKAGKVATRARPGLNA